MAKENGAQVVPHPEEQMKKIAFTHARSGGSNPMEFIAAIMDQMQQEMIEEESKGKIQTVTEFSKETRKIILPEGMSKKQAAQDLKNQWENEENMQDFAVDFDGWNWKDALVAINDVLRKEFGWVNAASGGFRNPMEIDVIVDIKDDKPIVKKAFYGEVMFTAWENAKGSIDVKQGTVVIIIPAKKKYSSKINEFFDMVRERLKTHSIFKNKAIEVGNNIHDIEITELKRNDMIVLNEDEEVAVKTFIIDQLDEKAKRTYLFTGDYGNGKTETANRIALGSLELGRTFFYIKNASQLSKVLEFSRKYEPATIFVEDIDEVAAGESRDYKMNNILNTVDGIQTKGRDIVTMFTTNHADAINSALRRPGRIDMIVEFKNPEKNTLEKIGRLYTNNIPGADKLDWEMIIEKMPDAQGAVVAEIMKRALKLAEKAGEIKNEHILGSIVSMKPQIEFMKADTKKSDPLLDALDILRDYLSYA